MQKISSPDQEKKRLAALRSYHILDTATEQDYEELTELAAVICQTPIALISLVDANRQWFKSSKGLDVSETDRAYSFCAHAIQVPDEIMQIEDANKDDRFKSNPLVTGDPHITFYAGVPLVDQEGHALGSLCVIDQQTRALTESQQNALRLLAKQVIKKIELRKQLTDSQYTSKRLRSVNNRLVTSEHELKSIINHLPLPAGVYTGIDMVIQFANPAMLSIMGKDESVIGMPYHLALPELSAMDFPKTMLQVMQTGISYQQRESHLTFMHKGELKEFFFNYDFTPLQNEAGQVWGLLNTATDVTATVKARIKAERAEDLFRLSVSSANMGTWHLDAKTNSLTASERTKELFGYLPHEDMPLDAAVTQIAPEYREHVTKAIQAAISAGESYDLEYPIIGHRDKKLRWVRATGKLYTKEDGSMTDFLGTLIDITERKMTEQRKNDFIGIVSHELRSPLTSLNGYIQMLDIKASNQGDELIAGIANKAKRQVDRMRTLITGFLDVARMNEGKIQLHRKRFDMKSLMKLAEEELMATANTHKLVFHAVEHILVDADQDKIEQVLINYINNAVKYSPGESTIRVSCIKENGEVKVCVKDEGMGLAHKDQQRVFERFYRVESEAMQTTKGFGIGLYLCRELVELHGGRAGVVSKLGKGSEFWFSLPVLSSSNL
ncbi:hypothetical protein GCM10027037_03220 [Mucilaginibacter koreensis]